MSRRRPFIEDRGLETAAGIALFLLGAILLHDAYDARGRSQPMLLRPFSFW